MNTKLDEQGNAIASQDDEALNSNPTGQEGQEEDAISVFNEITADSNDSNDDGGKVLDQELDKDKALSQDDAPAGTPNAEQGQPAAEVDPWASIPEAQRNEFKQLKSSHLTLQQNHRANSGRVNGLNAKLDEAKRKLEAFENANGGQDEGKPGPTSDDLKDKTFDEVKEEWPELASFVEAQVQQSEQRMSQRIDPLQQHSDSQQEGVYVQSQLAILQQAHPDFQQIQVDPNFHSWVALQGPTVNDMVQSNDADVNIQLLNLYKAQNRAPAPAPTPTPTPTPKPRKNTLADHAELPRKGPGKAAADPDDVDPVDFYNQITSNS